MPITRKDFIKRISQKMRNNELSIFLGAGISTPLGIPSWKNLMRPLANDLGLDIERQYDYYALAQYYVNTHDWAELKKHIGDAAFSFKTDSEALTKLLCLGLRTVWTTNFDESIEQTLRAQQVKYQVVCSDANLAYAPQDDIVTIYKLNGDIHDLEHIIITAEDWEAYPETHPTMIAFLKKELVSNTFLFYGYSFRDGLVKSALGSLSRFVGNSCTTHYSIQEKRDDPEFSYQIADLEARYHVKTLLVDSYNEVPQILDEIAAEAQKQNIFISGRMDDIDKETEDAACELGKSLSRGLLENKYNICTGMGRKIGYFVAGPAIQYLLEQGYQRIDHRLTVRPFDDTMSPGEKNHYRKKLIGNNRVVVFVYGHSAPSNRSPGMWEEYQIAQEQRKIIIPIGSTGYESRYIWEDVRNHITQYPYLEAIIDILGKETAPEKITENILKILRLIDSDQLEA